MDCEGLRGSLDVIVTNPCRELPAEGANSTSIVQETATANVLGDVGQLASTIVKSPLGTVPNTVRGAVPVFVSVSDWGELKRPTTSAPKFKLAGPTLEVGCPIGATPTPFNETDCGLPPALS